MDGDKTAGNGAAQQRLLESLPVVAYTASWGRDGRWLYLSPRIEALLGLTAEELVHDPELWERQVHPDDVEESRWRREVSVLDGASGGSFEYRMLGPDGALVWVLDIAEPAEGEDGDRVWHGVLVDVTLRKLEEEVASRSAGRQAVVAELSEKALANPAGHDALTEEIVTLLNGLDGIDQSFIWEVPAEGGAAMVRAGMRAPDGNLDWRRLSAASGTHAAAVIEFGSDVMVPDWELEDRFTPAAALEGLGVRSSAAVPLERDGVVVGALDAHSRQPGAFDDDDLRFMRTLARMLIDAGERRESDQSRRHETVHDPLTGLPNRLLFVEDVEAALGAGFASSSGVAVLFLDLDRFKLINDSFGHHAGDELLRAVGPRLRKHLRPGDTVARFGGDEFAVLVRSVEGEDAAVTVAERILDSFSAPFRLNNADHFVSASIGIAVAPPAPVEDGDADALIRDADAAMYRAKDGGRARCELFDHAMRAKAVRRLELERELRRALEEDEFVLHYQPIVALETGTVKGVEALIRWRHPQRGLLQPGDFIWVAEDSGLIEPIGRWVQDEACSQTRVWQEMSPEAGNLHVSVNLSARQVAHPDLPAVIEEVLAKTGLPPHSLQLEVTETILVEESGWAYEALQALHETGVHLALDDFGTGYSSLAYLNRFPFDSLKIDRSFVEGLGVKSDSRAIVEAIVGMARALDLRVVAEGVENQTQLSALRRLGCDFVQGYLFARPVPPDELMPLLDKPFDAVPEPTVEHEVSVAARNGTPAS